MLSNRRSFPLGTLTLAIPGGHRYRLQSHSGTVPNRWEAMQMSCELSAITSSSLIGHWPDAYIWREEGYENQDEIIGCSLMRYRAAVFPISHL